MTPDPMSHLRPGLSPYNYVQNDPLNRIDPFGLTDEREDGGIAKPRLSFINTLNSLMSYTRSIIFGSDYSSSGDNGNEVTASEVGGTNQGSSGGTSETLFMISGGLNSAGAVAGVGEYSNVANGYWIGANGRRYPLGWGGNQWTGTRSSVMSRAGAFRIVGRGFFVVGTGISLYQGGDALLQGNYGAAMKSGFDITMGAVATFGGPPGLAVGGFYFMTTYESNVPRISSPSYYIPDNTYVATPRWGR